MGVYLLLSIYRHAECCNCADDGQRHDETFLEGVFASRAAAERYTAEHLTDAPLAWSPRKIKTGDGLALPSDRVWAARNGAKSWYEIALHEVDED